MTERNVVHSTIVVDRRYPASPVRVFAAWADPAERARWDVPGEDWELTQHDDDFRVGGRQSSRFGPKGDPRFSTEGRYLDIVPNERIVSAGTMHAGDTRTSATLCTVELIAHGTGTRVVLTDQSAFFDGREEPGHREQGWREILDKLERYLAARDVGAAITKGRES